MNQNLGDLLLGPIVGHTDSRSTRIWIQVADTADHWTLEVSGHASVNFSSTEGGGEEFGTALAFIQNLLPDTEYDYEVRSDKEPRVVARGSFHTMPSDDARTDIGFVVLSCNDDREPNAWKLLDELITSEKPRFVLMLGDQIYVDEGEADIWTEHLDSPAGVRRSALVEKHRKLWATEPIRRIMSNTPTYMTWDDHDLRDGWGSFAGESAELLALHPAGQPIYDRYNAFFDDAYHVYWHFQACRNPAPFPPLKESRALPFVIRCGRLLVVVPDNRTDRDFARQENAILGDAQWAWLTSVAESIDATIEAIAIGTSVPVVDLDPAGKLHRLFAGRTDDIELFAQGDVEKIEELRTRRDNALVTLSSLLLGATVDPDFRVAKGLGFRISDLDDMRDKWSYETNRVEQERLIRAFAETMLDSQGRPNGRKIIFLGGDIHVGAIFEVTVKDLAVSFQVLVTSGIAKSAPLPEVVGVLVDSSFDVTPEIHAELLSVVNAVNFGAVNVAFLSGGPMMKTRVLFPAESAG